MTLLIVVLTITAVAVVARWAAQRLDPRLFRPDAPLAGPPHGDRDFERQLADLRAMRGYREDPPLLP